MMHCASGNLSIHMVLDNCILLKIHSISVLIM